MCSDYFARSVIQSLSRVWLFATSQTAELQASLSITSSWSLLKLMSMESVMPSNHLSLFCPLLLPLSIFPSIRVFSNESILCTVPETIYSAMEFKKLFSALWNSKTLLTFFPLYLLNLHFRDVPIIWYWHYFLYVWNFSQSPIRMTGGGLVAKSCLALATPWTAACQAPLSMEFSRQEYRSG